MFVADVVCVGLLMRAADELQIRTDKGWADGYARGIPSVVYPSGHFMDDSREARTLRNFRTLLIAFIQIVQLATKYKVGEISAGVAMEQITYILHDMPPLEQKP